MEICNLQSFLKYASEIDDLVKAAYVVSFYKESIQLQGKFSGVLVKKYFEKANMKIDQHTGYVEGVMPIVLDGHQINISITLTE